VPFAAKCKSLRARQGKSMITKDQFFEKKIFARVKMIELRNSFLSQTEDLNRWFKCEEYKSIQKTRTFFRNKRKKHDQNFPEEITYDFVRRIASWRITQPQVCHYCGIPESILDELHNQPNHQNKRWPKRGKVLEIDRKGSDIPYTNLTNLVLACYWCNNAKTDTFTYEEFREIGQKVNRVWSERLGRAFKIPD
jgi:hypothetical protein